MVISENYCNFIVFNYKVLQTIIAMITEDKVTELFCMADEMCNDYTLKSDTKRRYHRDSNVKSRNHVDYDIIPNRLCLKHFLSGHLFPKIDNVLWRKGSGCSALFIKKVLLENAQA